MGTWSIYPVYIFIPWAPDQTNHLHYPRPRQRHWWLKGSNPGSSLLLMTGVNFWMGSLSLASLNPLDPLVHVLISSDMEVNTAYWNVGAAQNINADVCICGLHTALCLPVFAYCGGKSGRMCEFVRSRPGAAYISMKGTTSIRALAEVVPWVMLQRELGCVYGYPKDGQKCLFIHVY